MSGDSLLDVPYRIARKIVIAVVGGTTIVIGIMMLALPGPGVLVLSLGLATLAIEFAFARRWLAQLKQAARDTYVSLAGASDATPSREESRDPDRRPHDGAHDHDGEGDSEDDATSNRPLS